MWILRDCKRAGAAGVACARLDYRQNDEKSTTKKAG